MNKIIYTSFLALSLGCGTLTRGPSSVSIQDSSIQKIQQLEVELTQKTNSLWEIDQLPQEEQTELGKTKKELTQIVLEREQTRQNLARALSEKKWNVAGPWHETTAKVNGLSREESFALRDLHSHRVDQGTTPPFALEHEDSSTYQLRLENLLPLPEGSGSESRDDAQQPPLKAVFECDGTFYISSRGLFGTSKKNVRSVAFDWYNNRQNAQKVLFELTSEVQKCQLKYKEKQSSSWTHQVLFQAAKTLIPGWEQLSSQVEVCARPVDLSSASSLTRFFWQQEFNAVTCARPLQEFATMRNPSSAFNEKIKSLTGSDLPSEVLKSRLPTAKLDFSKAPALDFIWVSSLSFTADLYGAILAQALRYHADRGTQIRILIPRARTFRKDEALLFGLQSGRPNVKLQIYSYNRTNGKSGDFLDQFHRVNHVKILLGYSYSKPENNFVVTGGRNIGDSYLLRKTPDYSSYPWLTNYKNNEKPFIHYDDFEVKFKGPEVTRSILTQLMSFWLRDSKKLWRKSTTLLADYNNPPELSDELEAMSKNKPMVRHIFSVPYADGKQLERFYVEMIRSAQKEILVTTPYFTPTKALSVAFNEAHKRGVTVKILTGMSLAGDDIPSIVEDANKKGVNEHVANLDIFAWNVPGTIMHAKIMVIDEKLSFISSVNLNGRSFTHDTESGLLILHEGVGRQVKQEITSYLKTSEQMGHPMKIKFLNGLLLKIMHSFF